jgi:hypothetical protein
MATTYTVWSGDQVHACGHHHKSIEAATKCGDKLYDSHYIGNYGQRVRSMNRGTWTASARWHNWFILDSTGQRVPDSHF